MNCLEPGSNPALPHSVAYQIPDEDAKLGGLLTEIEIQSKENKTDLTRSKHFSHSAHLLRTLLRTRCPYLPRPNSSCSSALLPDHYLESSSSTKDQTSPGLIFDLSSPLLV
jgi:hypothetical protein